MNQILVSEKIFVTPKVKKRKKRYKKIFYFSVILVVSLFSYYIYAENNRNKDEAISQEILRGINFGEFGIDTTIQEDVLVVGLMDEIDEYNEPIQQNNINKLELNNNAITYVTDEGIEYRIDSVLTIPSFDIKYPVLTETSDELLKISINKFWGPTPNSVGNYCIVGHNYKSGKMFGKLYKIENGDIIELQDSSGRILRYSVYNRFVVEPNDVSCTSQLTNGQKEMTLITCINSGTKRLVVKCREVK